MALRDDLIPILDGVRRDVVDGAVGLRLHTVVVRRRAWSGGRIGLGTPTDTDTVLDPRPKVRPPSPRLRWKEPGKFEDGDLVVSAISATCTEADLDGGKLPSGVEWYWRIDDEDHRVVSVEERFLGWQVHLRRMRQRSG